MHALLSYPPFTHPSTIHALIEPSTPPGHPLSHHRLFPAFLSKHPTQFFPHPQPNPPSRPARVHIALLRRHSPQVPSTPPHPYSTYALPLHPTAPIRIRLFPSCTDPTDRCVRLCSSLQTTLPPCSRDLETVPACRLTSWSGRLPCLLPSTFPIAILLLPTSTYRSHSPQFDNSHHLSVPYVPYISLPTAPSPSFLNPP